MSTPTMAAMRSGVDRGRIELKQTFTTPSDLWGYAFPVVVLVVVTSFMRGSTVPGTDFSLGTRTLPSVLGMGIVFSGLATLASQIIIEREDGTLLRAKATPNGMLGYLVGKITVISGMSLASLVLQLGVGLLLLDGLSVHGVRPWLTLAWVVVLGMVATLPLGAAVGSLFTSPRNMGLVMVPLFGLIAVSGIFYPISALPGWLQGIGQVFPVYWLGLGMRSALLPDHLAAAEIGQSWRHLETLGVLGAWAVLGLVLAPILLRRMARRESGSSVAERRERMLRQMSR